MILINASNNKSLEQIIEEILESLSSSIIPLKMKLLFSYEVAISSSSYLVQLDKSTLVAETLEPTASRERGLYIKQYDYLFKLLF